MRPANASGAYLTGEYNDRPALHMSAEPLPVFSHDGEHWQHVPAHEWDNEKKEGRFTLRAETDSLWLALVPPYSHSRLVRLLGEIAATPHTRVETVGRSVQERELQIVTVTDFTKPDADKKTVWLQARDHAWESPTSFIMEGTLKFDPARPFQVRPGSGGRSEGAAEPWWVAYDVPMALIETRIAPGKKLKGSPTAEHRLAFGRELLVAMAESVK